MKLVSLILLGMLGLAVSQTIDEIINSAAKTSHSMDLFQDDHTILIDMDMMFTQEDWEEIQKLNNTSRRQKRKAVRRLTKRWTNNIVYYKIIPEYSRDDRAQVTAAIADYHQYTCLKFVPTSSSSKPHLLIQNGNGCSAYVGMGKRGPQAVRLAPSCRQKGVIMHELGHAIGFHHEQTRPDRDNHVKILTENIEPHKAFNFNKYSEEYMNTYRVPYDYTSIMHYGQYAFTSNGKITIKTKDPDKQHLIGKAHGFSFRDVKLINLMYNCNANCRSKPKCPGEGYVGKDCQCWCPGNPVKKCGGGGGGGGEKKCEDTNSNCAYWAASGECNKNPAYMYESCKLSCKKCDGAGDGGGGGGGGTEGGKTNTACVDVKSYCGTLKRKGYCRKSRQRVFMVNHCRKTCNWCSQAKYCVDANKYCASWSRRGYCNNFRYRNYMLANCKKSCRACKLSTSPQRISISHTCRDFSYRCAGWARSGICYRNLVKSQCKKSCGLC